MTSRLIVGVGFGGRLRRTVLTREHQNEDEERNDSAHGAPVTALDAPRQAAAVFLTTWRTVVTALSPRYPIPMHSAQTAFPSAAIVRRMIRLEALTKRYGAAVAVDALSLEVEAGELVALVGGSGAGKTTTLKMINRLIEPTSGTVHIAGEDVTRKEPHLLRRRIGYVFQRIGLFPHLTVAENVAVTPSLLGWSPDRIAERVETLLTAMELDPALASRFPHELSGGQQQRVGVARALAAEPAVLLLDEPFGALDPITRKAVQIAFLRVHRTLGLTSVLVTHDVFEALLLADRVAVLRDGRLVQVGTPAELSRSPANDYVEALIRSPKQQARALAERLEVDT